MRPNTVTSTVADYCNAYNRGEVLVDRKYQRNARVWPERAQSYLIETILRGFPIPKLALHQHTDVKSRKSTKYVVDGQQRTLAIVDFFNDKLRLSRGIELLDAKGRMLSGLPEELQDAFLSYPLQFDQFEAVTDDEVREYFRRINSFTAPLNPEERRNANYQGNMKWLILQLAERHSDTMVLLGTLSEQQAVRMADRKLLAEIVHAMLNGVTTTDARALDSMYRQYEHVEIPDSVPVAIDSAFDRILGWNGIHDAQLLDKGYIVYSLALAIVAVDSNWSTLEEAIDQASGKSIHHNAELNLAELSDALRSESESEYFAEFIEASSEKTNTKAQRETRIRWIANALTRAEW